MNAIWVVLHLLLGDNYADTKASTKHYGKARSCISTIFGMRGDKWAGGNALYLGRPVKPSVDVGIAHRTLPVGSLVVLNNPKKDTWVVAQVIDRGPYGALLGDNEAPSPGQYCKERKDGSIWCVKKKKSQAGKWRGCVDTTPKAAELLKHNGYQRIRYWAIPDTAPASIWDWPAYKKKGKKKK